jgi:hypothetical protein
MILHDRAVARLYAVGGLRIEATPLLIRRSRPALVSYVQGQNPRCPPVTTDNATMVGNCLWLSLTPLKLFVPQSHGSGDTYCATIDRDPCLTLIQMDLPTPTGWRGLQDGFPFPVSHPLGGCVLSHNSDQNLHPRTFSLYEDKKLVRLQ